VSCRRPSWPPCRRRRVMFPLHSLHTGLVKPGLSRGCRQRLGKQRNIMHDANLAIRAVSWLAKGGTGELEERRSGDSDPESAAARSAREFILQKAVDRGLPPADFCAEEAIDALLREKAGYDTGNGPTNVTAFVPGRVSLPGDTTGAPFLEDVLPPDALKYFEGDYAPMLKSQPELLEMEDHAEPIKPYMDVVLRTSRAKYLAFVKDLIERRLVQVTLDPKEHVTIFFVKKKDHSLRMVVDSRRPNRRFRAPPGVSLATPESFARLESENSELWMAEADVDNCFHRLRLNEKLGRFFCLPSLTASELGLSAVGGRVVHGLERVWPCLAVAPMGWTWSLYFAQTINQRLVADSLRDVPALGSDQAGIVLSESNRLAFYVYVDNVGVVGVNEKEVNEAMAGCVLALEDSGLKCHPATMASTRVEVLGIEFNSELGCFRPTSKRYWRLRALLKWALRRRTLCGKQLEVILGHATFFAMINRCSLCVFNTVYKFIRASYERPQRLWQTCRDELAAFLGLMPLVVAEWKRGWSDTSLCYDSCDDGRGYCSREVGAHEAGRIGRTLERSRYRRVYGGRAARESALRRLNPFKDLCTVRTAPPTSSRTTKSGKRVWISPRSPSKW